MNFILKFSRKSKTVTNDIIAKIVVGLWRVDPLDGGILTHAYPNTSTENSEITKTLALKIKDFILIQTRDSNFKSEWSIGPLTIVNQHFYLYGFFARSKWLVITIQLPIDFSFFLIDEKSELIIFESSISSNINFVSEDRWGEVILKPLWEAYLVKLDEFTELKKSKTSSLET